MCSSRVLILIDLCWTSPRVFTLPRPHCHVWLLPLTVTVSDTEVTGTCKHCCLASSGRSGISGTPPHHQLGPKCISGPGKVLEIDCGNVNCTQTPVTKGAKRGRGLFVCVGEGWGLGCNTACACLCCVVCWHAGCARTAEHSSFPSFTPLLKPEGGGGKGPVMFLEQLKSFSFGERKCQRQLI